MLSNPLHPGMNPVWWKAVEQAVAEEGEIEWNRLHQAYQEFRHEALQATDAPKLDRAVVGLFMAHLGRFLSANRTTLRSFFDELDPDHDAGPGGGVPCVAFKRSLRERGFEAPMEQWEAALSCLDPRQEGTVLWKDLHAAFLDAKEKGWAAKEAVESFFRALEKHLRARQMTLRGIFREMDATRRGAMDAHEFRKRLEEGGFQAPQQQWESTFAAVGALEKGDIELEGLQALTLTLTLTLIGDIELEGLQAALAGCRSTLNWELQKEEGKGELPRRRERSPNRHQGASAGPRPGNPEPGGHWGHPAATKAALAAAATVPVGPLPYPEDAMVTSPGASEAGLLEELRETQGAYRRAEAQGEMDRRDLRNIRFEPSPKRGRGTQAISRRSTSPPRSQPRWGEEGAGGGKSHELEEPQWNRPYRLAEDSEEEARSQPPHPDPRTVTPAPL